MDNTQKNIKTPAEKAKEQELRNLLLNAVKKKCEPFEKNMRASMAEKYPLGMTPEDVANEIEEHVEDGKFTAEMPNVNLSADSIEGAIIEGQGQAVVDALLVLAMKVDDPNFGAFVLTVNDQIDKYNQIQPAVINAQQQEEQEKKLAETQQQEIAEHNEMDRQEEACEREQAEIAARREEKREPIIKSPKRMFKEAMGLDR